MREILFRGKRADNNEWVEGYYTIDDSISYIHIHFDFDRGYHLDEIEVIPETVGQFTGLKDKNGKKIFECDILELHSHTDKYQIKWNNDYGYYFYDGLVSDCTWNTRKLSKIIGNIHDNPELLK
jgi:uncharacterized phage protein (TIGR01671 family)